MEVEVMRIYLLLTAVFLLAACSGDDDNGVSYEENQSSLPAVSITSPHDGAVLRRGIYPVDVDAYYESGIKYVMVKIGMKDVRYDYEEPYSFVWIVMEDADPAVGEGPYQICATAVSNTGESKTSCIDVSVDYQ